ncbi:MAG TPA: acyl-CoA dehydrogenase family protein [Thermoplasmata archaeon]|nr:acyl-CoA dehydrogenase family protein [Thermoplasmata archaeon]
MERDASGSPETWRRAAHVFAVNHVRGAAAGIDREDRIPPALVQGLARERFLGLGIPVEWGGSDGTARTIAAVLEELSWGSAAVGVLTAVHLSVASAPIVAWGTAEQKDRLLPPMASGGRLGAFGLTEPDAGSDAASLRSRYRRTERGFVLEARKMFISNAVAGGIVLVFATRDPSVGRHGISTFLVPVESPGFSIAQRLDKLGLRGSETSELVLDSVALGPDALLGPEGAGLKVALSALAGGRVGIAACALGVARAAFDELRANVRRDDAEWKRTLLAQGYAELGAARALVERAAARKDSGEPFARDASVAKLVASRAAVRIASWGVDVAGAEGTRVGAPPERLLRDARVFPIVEGTTEIQELVLARELLADPSEPNP